MTLRVFVDQPLSAQSDLDLPEEAARHVQVVRMQPGEALVLFDGRGGEWDASVRSMGRRDVRVDVVSHREVDRELSVETTIAVGMPANERMDALVEKATELGVAGIQPLLMSRSVLKLAGERAEKRVAHWQAVAIGAAEQSGRTRVPQVAPVQTLGAWLAALPAVADGERRHVMSTGEAPTLASRLVPDEGSRRWLALSGPEGGLTAEEEALSRDKAFAPVSLGARILRADTAPLLWLAQLAMATSQR
jgi:16S rRNA (uracil1498-N3)-methyltransferase